MVAAMIFFNLRKCPHKHALQFYYGPILVRHRVQVGSVMEVKEGTDVVAARYIPEKGAQNRQLPSASRPPKKKRKRKKKPSRWCQEARATCGQTARRGRRVLRLAPSAYSVPMTTKHTIAQTHHAARERLPSEYLFGLWKVKSFWAAALCSIRKRVGRVLERKVGKTL
jgi:hypothetical protein